jgi:hypothetical protein
LGTCAHQSITLGGGRVINSVYRASCSATTYSCDVGARPELKAEEHAALANSLGAYPRWDEISRKEEKKITVSRENRN